MCTSSPTSHGLVRAAALLWLAVAACYDNGNAAGGSDGGPCALCLGGEVCAEGVCVRPCLSADPCPAGHACRDFGGVSGCDPVCDPSLCDANAREDCRFSGGDCEPVVCSARVPCANAADICEVETERCFPSNGDCRDGGACPAFGSALGDAATVECGSGGLCRVRPKLSPPDFLDVDRAVTVRSPEPGHEYAPGDLPTIAWDAVAGAVTLVLVTDATFPDSEQTLHDHAVWGAALREGQTRVTWGAGHPIRAGRWLDASPAAPASGRHYLIVQAVRRDDLAAVSVVVPFRVGTDAPWSVPGDRCVEPGVPGSCDNPGIILGCVAGRCRRVCASDADCDPSHRCQRPSGGLRVCSL